MSKKIGVDYEMMTYSEMSYYVEELEEEAREQGETLSVDDIEEKIKEEYGLFNALAYSRDFIIGDEDDETTVNNVINDLLFVYYFSEGPSVEEDKQIKTLRTQNLYTYKNSLIDDSLKNEKEQVKVRET